MATASNDARGLLRQPAEGIQNMASSSLQQSGVESTPFRAATADKPPQANSTRAVSLRRALSGGEALKLANAAPCDHQAIGRLLISVHQRPTSEDFALQLEHPHDEPSDRLLVKRAGQIVGHVQMQWRSLMYLGAAVPICRLAWLAVLPEYRRHGVDDWLIDTAVDLARVDRALLVEFDGTIPPSAARPWMAEGALAARWQDSPRDVLSRLSVQQSKSADVTVRNWRQMELDELCEIYHLATSGTAGPLIRTEAHWRWLIERSGYDHIFVALRSSTADDRERVVGYCVSRREHLLELLTAPGEEQAAVELLRRSARDAIERGFHRLVLHGSPRHVLAGSFAACAETPGRMLLPDAAGWLRHIRDELAHRAGKAELPLPVQLPLRINKRPLRLEVTRRKASLTAGKPLRRCLAGESGAFAGLLLGTVDADALLEANKLSAPSARAAEVARQLFPRLPWWRPLWDELPRS
ncbi:MAG: GNAT family N-acetyltransferase [Pirellulales bacterium]